MSETAFKTGWGGVGGAGGQPMSETAFQKRGGGGWGAVACRRPAMSETAFRKRGGGSRAPKNPEP